MGFAKLALHRNASTVSSGRLRQLIRCHLILDRLTDSRIGYNANMLAEELGLTTKTIYRDIRALRAAGVPISYTAQGRRYRLVKNRLVKGYLGESEGTLLSGDPSIGELRVGLREASRYLGLSPRDLKTRVEIGEVPGIREGHSLRFLVRDLLVHKQRMAQGGHPRSNVTYLISAMPIHTERGGMLTDPKEQSVFEKIGYERENGMEPPTSTEMRLEEKEG